MRLRKREPGRPTFRRQHPFGPYILDFYCSQARLCIEVDGVAHSMGNQPARDIRRDAFLRANGVEVVRLTAAYVLEDPERATDWVRQLAFDRLGARTAHLLGED